MSLQNAFGKVALEESIQMLVQLLSRLDSTLGRWYPNTSGQMAVAGPVTVSSGTVTTLTNQTQQSGISTSYDQYAQMMVSADAVRSKITVT